MQKKMIIIFSLFLATAHQQFTALHNTAKHLQRFAAVDKNSVFTNEFLSLRSWYKDRPIKEIRMVSEVCLDNDLKNEIFKLAVEEEVAIKILLSRNVVQEQEITISDMIKDGIDVVMLPNEQQCINWQHRNKRFKFITAAALISYESGDNATLYGKPKDTLCIHNDYKFDVLTRKFDYLFRKLRK